MSKTIKCPTCGKPSVFEPSNKFRPFCSERCQLLDLGRWADEKYSVPGESVDPHTEVNENPNRGEDDGDSSSSPVLH
jgi:endogenous inhibitor of DNA gyrase (YacG/DUF329 family)